MADRAGEPGARYRAFISYSHRDSAFGRRLHRRLEGYWLPRRLVGRATPRGPAPRRLAPIFRDREDLSAAHDLTAEVRAALADSGALIVVCSPHAAASPWVAREVELFRELHPDRPVLAALIAGEPAEAFPEPLRRGEPLAADFRPGGDGARPALLKLVAGVVGVGLDELVQRDAQRRLRGVMAVTAGAVAATLVMALLTIFALDARTQAERQRAEAEALVEFMLTDLRDRLEGVGRLDVLTAVNQRALGYYADQNLKRLPPTSLERRARILHAMGEDDEARGDLGRALTEFQEARRTTAALLAAAPDDPDRIFNHAQSEYWVAYLDWRRRRFAAAEAGFKRYAALARKLLAIDPSNPDWQMEAGYADSNLGMVTLRDKGDASGAEPLFRSALDHLEDADRAKPGDAAIKRDIADGYAWLADSQKGQGRFDEARGSRREEAKILAALLAADPNNSVYARDRLGNELGLAQIDLAAGRPAEARARLVGTYAKARGLAAADPDDVRPARHKLAIGLVLAKATLLAGGPADAAVPYLADCHTELAQGDQEVSDLCALTAARVAIARRRPSLAFDYLRANEVRLNSTPRSARWGVDFRSELASLKELAEERE